jgi:Galactose oxidase, central domain
MVYDYAAGAILLFGGANISRNQNQSTNDTWEFSKGKWINVTPPISPPARFDASMVYDGKEGYVILFGGYTLSPSGKPRAYFGDTWKFSKGSWANITSHSRIAPSPRASANAAYDARDHDIVLFGGNNSLAAPYVFNDTWTFSNGTWNEVNVSRPPPHLFAASMSYDPSSQSIVLFGGAGNSNATWQYTRGVWTKLRLTVSPSGREDAMLAYDTKTGYLLLFGGAQFGKGNLHDTWKFQHGVWIHLTPVSSPPSLALASMAFDSSDGYMVLFGGTGNVHGETWEYL